MKITIETGTWKPKGSRDHEKERESAQELTMLVLRIPMFFLRIPFIIMKELWEIGNKWFKKN